MTRKDILIRTSLVILFCLIALLLIRLPSFFRRSGSPGGVPGNSDGAAEYTDGAAEHIGELVGEVPVSEAAVTSALSNIADPELDINIVDLGLVYNIDVDTRNNVIVVLVLTSPGCPWAGTIVKDVKETLLSIEGIESVKVQIDLRTRWNPDMMTETGKRLLEERFR